MKKLTPQHLQTLAGLATLLAFAILYIIWVLQTALELAE